MIGVVGLGNMGYPMAVNLLRAGYKLKVYSRHMDSANVKDVITRGALPAYSLKELAEECDTVILSLPSAQASNEVVIGENGLYESLAPGSTIIETSTVPPSLVIKLNNILENRKINLLDAPVSGGRIKAERGELTIMVGGKKPVYERSLSILKVLGKRIHYVGDLGNGQLIKLLNSFMALANLFVARSCCLTARKKGVDLSLFKEIINNSTGNSWIWENWIPLLINGQEVKSKIKIALKDLSYAQELFQSNTPEWELIEIIKTSLKNLMTNEEEDLSVLFKDVWLL
jgi:2-hydroxy-3-oxopropionate reductase